MRYAIIANPGSGRLPVEKKRSLLKRVSRILNAQIHGLDTGSAGEFYRCARELSHRCDVLVVAGGDGTLSGVINAIYPSRLSLAFLPLGTGNAIQHALGYRGGPDAIARRILTGRWHKYDLIRCNGKRLAFMASVGLDGTAVELWTRYRKAGHSGLKTYFIASLKAYLTRYRPVRVRLTIDGRSSTIERLLSLIIVKQPYFGLGMKMVPRARWDDGCLHALSIPAGLHRMAMGLATSFTIGNRIGDYRTGTKAEIRSEKPLMLQIDGEPGWCRDAFSFEVLPSILNMKH